MNISILKNKYLLILLAISILVRVALLGRDYPYLLNVDEGSFVRSVSGLRFTFIIDRFDWPHLGFLIHFLFQMIFIKFRGLLISIGLGDSLKSFIPILFEDPYILFLVTKFINAIFGVAALIPTFYLAKELAGVKAAKYAATCLALMPFFLTSSVFAMIDVPMVVFIMASLYFMLLSLKEKSLKKAIIAGILIGCAGSIKYNGFFFAPIYYLFGIYVLSRYQNLPTRKAIISSINYWKYYIFAACSCVILYLIADYSIFFKFDTFWSYQYGRGILWQLFVNSKSVKPEDYIPHVFELIYKTLSGMNVIFSIAILFCIIFLAYKSKENNLKTTPLKFLVASLSIFCLLYFIYLSKGVMAGARYFIPMYGIVAVIFGVVLDNFNRKINNEKLIYLIFSISLIPVIYAFILNYRVSTYVIALNTIKSNQQNSYIQGTDLYSISELNLTRFKKFRNNPVPGNLIYTEDQINDSRYILTNTIDNYLRTGKKFYVYEYK